MVERVNSHRYDRTTERYEHQGPNTICTLSRDPCSSLARFIGPCIMPLSDLAGTVGPRIAVASVRDGARLIIGSVEIIGPRFWGVLETA